MDHNRTSLSPKKLEKKIEKRAHEAAAREAAHLRRPKLQIECVHAHPHQHDRPVRMLFVITTFISDERNCAILANTLASIGCHHPSESVLVVDNASPPGAIDASIAAAGEGARSSVFHVSRENFSRGQLGACDL